MEKTREDSKKNKETTWTTDAMWLFILMFMAQYWEDSGAQEDNEDEKAQIEALLATQNP